MFAARFSYYHRRHTGTTMELQAQGLEHRLAELEAQIARLNVALQHWRDAQDHLQPMEHRLSQLTDQCADVLKQWTATGERHALAVGELEARLTGWNEVETRLQRDASSRFQALERVIEQEWSTLRHLHEEPARQLRAHADSLTEICVTTAGSAQTGLERAEARLATIERDLHRRMDDLSRDVHAAVAELRHRNEASALRGPSTPWSLDEVTRLHSELRDGSAPLALARSGAIADAESSPQPVASGLSLTSSPSQTGVVDIASGQRSEWRWYAAVAVLALATGLSIVFAMSFYRQAGNAAAQATQAQQHAEEIATAADKRIEAARQDAATSIAQARETASKAQVTSDVLAAPDLVRFNLTGGEGAARVSAQLLWSRSRGMVFSGSRLPTPPAGSTYQIWLLTSDRAVSAGTFAPDTAGRVTAATDTPPNVPPPITGVRVTLEPTAGAAQPSGAIVLARVQ
jgi:hypothetical protein